MKDSNQLELLLFGDPLLQHVCPVQDVLQRFESFFERYLAPKQRTRVVTLTIHGCVYMCILKLYKLVGGLEHFFYFP